jgi:HlyD family secretion protein
VLNSKLHNSNLVHKAGMELNMKKRYIIITVIVLIIIGAIVIVPTMIRKRAVLTVKTQAVQKGDVQSWFSATGIVASNNIKQYYGTSQAKVTAVNVKAGDKVQKGQVLATFDISDLQTALKQTQLQLSTAQLQYDDTQNTKNKITSQINDLNTQITALHNSTNLQDKATLQTLQTQKSTLQSQLMSDDKMHQLDNSVQLAELSVSSAQKKLSDAKTGIVADIDGIVTSVNLIVGATIPMSQPSIVVQDNKSLKVIISLGKYDIEKVKINQSAKITSGNTTFDGQVSFISPAATTVITASGQTTALNCEITIKNPTDALKLNFEADVDILTGDVKDILEVPVECVKTDKDGTNYVFVLNNRKVKRVNCTLGVSSDTNCQIISGLSVGQKVILNPSENVMDGVRAVEATS